MAADTLTNSSITKFYGDNFKHLQMVKCKMIKRCFLGLVICIIFEGHLMAESRSHTENFNGVDITFFPPNMHEQRSFQLRGVISKKETEILAPAIPVIAKLLNYARRKNAEKFFDKINEPRRPFNFAREDATFASFRTHSWRITDDSIVFISDYLVSYGIIPNSTIGEYLFRDAYIFKKIDEKWIFYDNYGEKPYGFLKCKYTDKDCSLDTPLW